MGEAAGPQTRSHITALLERHGLRPRRALGQHFLADPNLVDKIVRLAAITPGDKVVEIGAGTGTLTRALAAAGASVVAYEIDRRLEPVLAETVGGLAAVEVRFEDATAADLNSDLGEGEWIMVANLPYNIGTTLLLDLLAGAPRIVRYVVMVQREVADRLAAGPGSKRYGLPSVTAGLYGAVRFGFAVPPQVFVPAPEVGSAVVVVERRAVVDARAPRARELAGAAFGGRRKMLRRSLAGMLDDPITLLASAGISPTSRAEDLSPDDFLRLAAAEGT